MHTETELDSLRSSHRNLMGAEIRLDPSKNCVWSPQ